MKIIITSINPEPWAIGPVSTWAKGRGSIGPNLKLVAYQEAIREELSSHEMLPHGDYMIAFSYWRSTAGGKPCDVTNLNKALEDALQGVIYDNDRTNRFVAGEIIEQSPTTEPGIIINIAPYQANWDMHNTLEAELAQAREANKVEPWSNMTDWAPPTGDVI